MFTQKLLLTFVISIFGVISFSQCVPVGDSCSKNEDCDGYPESTICDAIMGVCYCNDRHIPVRGQPHITCEPIRMKIGETCKVSDQCTQGLPGYLSDCLPSYLDPTQYICNCTAEAVHEPGEHVCIPKRNFIGDLCEIDLQCKVNLGDLCFCNSHECACTAEAVANKNGTFCLPIVNFIGGQCEEGQQCKLGTPGTYSDCVESYDDPNVKICNCTAGAKPEPGEHQCLKLASSIGEACELDENCVGSPGISSACSNSGKCLCLGGYLYSGLMDDCLAIKNGLGESCQESEQCQQGISGMLSACILGSCRCTSFSINEPGEHYCHMKATLVGDPCQVHEQCWANLSDKSHCIGGRCECTRGSQP